MSGHYFDCGTLVCRHRETCTSRCLGIVLGCNPSRSHFCSNVRFTLGIEHQTDSIVHLTRLRRKKNPHASPATAGYVAATLQLVLPCYRRCPNCHHWHRANTAMCNCGALWPKHSMSRKKLESLRRYFEKHPIVSRREFRRHGPVWGGPLDGRIGPSYRSEPAIFVISD